MKKNLARMFALALISVSVAAQNYQPSACIGRGLSVDALDSCLQQEQNRYRQPMVDEWNREHQERMRRYELEKTIRESEAAQKREYEAWKAEQARKQAEEQTRKAEDERQAQAEIALQIQREAERSALAACKKKGVFEQYYQECLLDNLPSARTEFAAAQILRNCDQKAPCSIVSKKKSGVFGVASAQECFQKYGAKHRLTMVSYQIQQACDQLYVDK